jgi:FkbM family methyltransferase
LGTILFKTTILESGNELAPIVLFVYNRPWHTRQTLEALAKNELAEESTLFIYADGPKTNASEDDLTKINEVRKLIREKSWCKSVEIIESDVNKGLADSIISGVTEIVNRYGKIIVLEDDIVTSVGFLRYMNNALTMYQNEETVMHISGYMYPINKSVFAKETHFLSLTSCWGWATWRRSWKYFHNVPSQILQEIVQRNLYQKITFNNTNNNFQNQLEKNLSGEIKTWGIYWHCIVIAKNGLCLHPYMSLIKNIGLDGTGTNCRKTEFNSSLDNFNPHQEIKLKRLRPKLNYQITKKLENYFDLLYSSKKYTLRDKLYIKRQLFKEKGRDIYKILFTSNHYLVQSKSPFQTHKRYIAGSSQLNGIKTYYNDRLAFEFMANELFVNEIYKFKCESKNPLIIDCGVNIGLSLIYFKSIFPNSKIIGFEPEPSIFELAKKNIKAHNLADIELINKALWHEERQIEYFKEGADGGRINFIEGTEKIIIETTVLSKYLNSPIDLLKIDIEGAEINVLKEVSHLLLNVENIFIEYHSFVNKNQDLDEILAILKNNRFRYYLSSTGVSSKNPFIQTNSSLGMDNQLNIFARKIHSM